MACPIFLNTRKNLVTFRAAHTIFFAPILNSALQRLMRIKEGFSVPSTSSSLAPHPTFPSSSRDGARADRTPTERPPPALEPGMGPADVALLLLERSVLEWNAAAERQQEASLAYGIAAASDRGWALSAAGLSAGLARADELTSVLRASKEKSLVEVIGRKLLTRPESEPGLETEEPEGNSLVGDSSLLFSPDASVRIVEFLLQVADTTKRAALMAEAFVPPGDADAATSGSSYGEADEVEDLLFTTPLRLLQAVDVELRRAGRGGVDGAENKDPPPDVKDWAAMGRAERLRVLRRETWAFCF